jgi:hypothetical protein
MLPLIRRLSTLCRFVSDLEQTEGAGNIPAPRLSGACGLRLLYVS